MKRSAIPACCGLVVLVVVLVCGIAAPLIAPYEESFRDDSAVLQSPSKDHWLGTDEDGADLLSQVIFGARVAVIVGLATVAICALVGCALGAVSGYAGGWLDELLMRFCDVVLSFPWILLALFIMFLSGKPGLGTEILALSATGWAGYARLVRGQVLQLKECGFVEALQALGGGAPRIVWRHIVPNLLGPVVVQATFGVAGAILAEASVSFLGLGPTDYPSWGQMLEQGAVLFIKSPLIGLVPGAAIFVTILSINFLGDWLRDRLDPKHV